MPVPALRKDRLVEVKRRLLVRIVNHLEARATGRSRTAPPDVVAEPPVARRGGDDSAGSRLATEVAALSPEVSRAAAAAFTLYFDLINLAEESQRVIALREREREQHPKPYGESVAETIASLKASGVADEKMKTLLDNLRVELVITAHPTEAKRRTTLSKLERIARAIQFIREANPTPREHAEAVNNVRAEITSLWLTDRARTQKPAVTD